MSAEAPIISDAWIAERWPNQDPAEVRRRFDALMDKLGETPWRGIPGFPELMANVLAAAARLPSQRIDDLVAAAAKALGEMPQHIRDYEWFAGKPAFGDQYVSVYGDDGHGMGRQAIACSPGGKAFGIAPFIAAVSPRNVLALLGEIHHLRQRVTDLLNANNREVERRRSAEAALRSASAAVGTMAATEAQDVRSIARAHFATYQPENR